MTGARISHYDWSGGREAMLRFGPDDGPVVIAALPLFEEANRTRAVVVDVLRRLAEHGIGGALPDLPGTGDSLIETADATLADWRAAFAAAAATLSGPVHMVAWRGGALVAAGVSAASQWYLAPVGGADVLRDLRRAQSASGDTHSFAGNRLSPTLIEELEAATCLTSVRPELVEGRPASITGADRKSSGRTSTGSAGTDLGPSSLIRTVRLDTDPRPADRKLPGRPLWRAVEPDTDAALQAAIADDIADWIASCAR